jgi:hypothetical protein
MSEQPDDVVYEFEAGRHTIRARLSHFRGKTYLDLRTWYEPEPGQPLRPTQKGVSVGVEYLEELKEAVDALAAAVRQEKRPGPRRAVAA